MILWFRICLGYFFWLFSSIFRVFPECFGYFWGDSFILTEDVRGDPPAGWWLLSIICPEYSLPQVLVVNISSVLFCKCGYATLVSCLGNNKSPSPDRSHDKNKSGDRPLQPGHAYLQLIGSSGQLHSKTCSPVALVWSDAIKGVLVASTSTWWNRAGHESSVKNTFSIFPTDFFYCAAPKQYQSGGTRPVFLFQTALLSTTFQQASRLHHWCHVWAEKFSYIKMPVINWSSSSEINVWEWEERHLNYCHLLFTVRTYGSGVIYSRQYSRCSKAPNKSLLNKAEISSPVWLYQQEGPWFHNHITSNISNHGIQTYLYHFLSG